MTLGNFGDSLPPISSARLSMLKICFALLTIVYGTRAFAQELVLPEEKTTGLSGFSIDVSLPNGGSPFGVSAAGLRWFASDNFALSIFAQAGYDRTLEKTIYGGALRGEYFFAPTGKAYPYTFLQLSTGQTKVKRDTPSTSATTGAGLGGGVEVYLIPELSLSADVGFASNFAPASSLNVTTFTSNISLHLHF